MTPTPVAEVSGSNIRSKVIDLGGVNARLYEPIKKKEGSQPGFIFFHGGGMCFGSIGENENIVTCNLKTKQNKTTAKNPPLHHVHCGIPNRML